MTSRFRSSAGFTLIEILVAMTILFAVITSGFLAYQNSLNHNERATKTMFALTALPYIQQQIQQQLLANPEQLSGEGQLLSVDYHWQSSPGPLTAAPPEFDPGLGEVPQRTRFQLHQITLTIGYQQIQRDFHYQELTWLP